MDLIKSSEEFSPILQSSTLSSDIKNHDMNLNNIKNSIVSTSLIFDENIERVWFFIRDGANIPKIASKISINYKLIKGKNTWTEGSEFSFYWIGVSTLNCKCTQIKDNEDKKIMTREINAEIGISYIKTYYLYSISDTNNTLVKILMSKIPSKQNNQVNIDSSKDYFEELHQSLLVWFSDYISKSKLHQINNESFLLNHGISDTWEYMTNFKKLCTICPSIGTNFCSLGDPIQAGAFIKYFLPQANRIGFLRVTYVDKDTNKNKWVYKYETFGTDCNITKTDTTIIITKINEKKSQVTVIHSFKEHIEKKKLDVFLLKKRKILEKIRNYLNNINNNKIIYSSENRNHISRSLNNKNVNFNI